TCCRSAPEDASAGPPRAGSGPSSRDLVGGVLLDGALVGTQLDGALERVELDDAPAVAALLVTAAPALLRHPLEQFLVHVVLVLQAAHQAATGTADLLGVERELLVAGHPYAHRAEALQPRGAAGAVATHAQRAEDPGLVTRADVGELDARRGVFHQLLRQHPDGRLTVGGVADDQKRLVDGELERDDLEVGAHLPGPGPQQPLEPFGLLPQLVVALHVI